MLKRRGPYSVRGFLDRPTLEVHVEVEVFREEHVAGAGGELLTVKCSSIYDSASKANAQPQN